MNVYYGHTGQKFYGGEESRRKNRHYGESHRNEWTFGRRRLDRIRECTYVETRRNFRRRFTEIPYESFYVFHKTCRLSTLQAKLLTDLFPSLLVLFLSLYMSILMFQSTGLLSAYPGSGRGGSSSCRGPQTSLSRATLTNSDGGIPRRSQASVEI